MILGDAASQGSRTAAHGMSETYICPEGFNGKYRVLVHRVWGKVTAGRVTVDVYSHYGTSEERHLTDQVAVGDQDALVVFDLVDGRRQEPLGEQQLANAAVGQLAVNQAILAQQISSMANQTSVANMDVSRRLARVSVHSASGRLYADYPNPSGWRQHGCHRRGFGRSALHPCR